MALDYYKWIDAYSQSPLFVDIDPQEAVKLMEAMQPPLYTVKKGTSIFDEYDSTYMYFCLGSTPPEETKITGVKRSKWSLVGGFATPGLLAGKVPTASGFNWRIGPQSERTIQPADTHFLLITMENFLKHKGEELWPVQKTMIRNLIGILGQAIVETRALFYKARHGIDMFELKGDDRFKYPEIHSDPVNWE